MAELTVDGLGELTSPAANDEIGIWDVSANQYMKITRSTLVGATLTGGGTVATGGYTLTVPATGTAALLATAQTFTKKQTIAPDSNTIGLQISQPGGNVNSAALYITRNAAGAAELATLSSGYNYLYIYAADVGNGSGQFVQVGRNTNASTPAAAHIDLEDKSGQYYSIWPDDSGVLRIHTSIPTNSTDAGGTVVGAQTSSLDAKHIIGDPLSAPDILAAIQAGAEAVRRFSYRSGAYNGEEFSGVVVDYAPRYGMDRDAEHPAGKSLNVVTVVGDLLLAVAHLAQRVAALEERG